jgi:hypothetical protein
MSGTAKWEYFVVIYKRYRAADRSGKRVILDEFCETAGYHRKYAIRLLNGVAPGRCRERRRSRHRPVKYSAEAVWVLLEIWKAANYPWSVRLKALLPLWMPWVRRRFCVGAEVQQQLLGMSARQMDRRLRKYKTQLLRRMYGRTKPGTLLKHHIPIKTDHWDVQTTGFGEVDLVSHSGDNASGEFAYSLNLTDIHSTWTESRAVLGRGEKRVRQGLEEIQQTLPFRLRGIDSDNGSEFINAHLYRYCAKEKIQFTRGRPYRKNDNAHIEQKNWTHVRQLLGWERYDTRAAVAAMNDLYRHELRLWLNLFLPSVKLIGKVRVGSKLRRVYGPAETPLARVAACAQSDPARVVELEALQRSLDPFALSQVVEQKIEAIWNLAHPQRRAQKPKHKDLISKKEETNTGQKPAISEIGPAPGKGASSRPLPPSDGAGRADFTVTF